MAHSGYDKERFTTLGFEEFDCLICSEVAMDPLECDGCGKLFCKICINDWISKNPATKCPNRCVSQISPIRSKALLKVYNNLDIKCSNAKCGKVLKLGDLATHENVCLRPKCWNYEVCEKAQNDYIKGDRPCCSELCQTLYKLDANFGNVKEMYKIINSLNPQSDRTSGNVTEGNTATLCWDTSRADLGIDDHEWGSHSHHGILFGSRRRTGCGPVVPYRHHTK